MKTDGDSTAQTRRDHAPGRPGLPPTWASSDKDFVTSSLGPARLWATFGHGIVNEIYWPSTGQPQLRDLGFHLTGQNRWIDLKRVRRYRIVTPPSPVPLLTIMHEGDDYRLSIAAVPDPHRDVLLLHFELEGPYQLVLLAAPHLGGTGNDNEAWTHGSALFATRGDHALCITADVGLRQPSVGYVGVSDGWQDLNQNGRLSWSWQNAGPGNVALVAQPGAAKGVIAIGFADSARGAETLARASVAMGFDQIRRAFVDDWVRWGRTLRLPDAAPELARLARLSATVVKAHEDRIYPGALVASLSTPWGNRTDTLGGYHLVWPRDVTLTAFALIAIGQIDDARRVLARFIATQEDDGHWVQNSFPSGEPFWSGVQLDETAFPVLLAAKLREIGADELPDTRGMVRRALAYVARTGPSSPQDRWEENPGVSPFTAAVAIAALVAGAPWLDPAEASSARELANEWSERLEHWCYVGRTPLAESMGVEGYYVRLGTPEADQTGANATSITLRNRSGETIRAAALVSLDFSYLVRLGIRSVSDPRVQDTIKVVDRVLRVSTPSGDLYRRYTDDGYGEHADGSPFDGSGIGRLWPLLAGERGHLALQSGTDPTPWLQTMCRCASDGGLLPEQVWDAAPIPDRGLTPGRPSGSAMPLLWAHAEFLKLLASRATGRPVELLEVVESHFHDPPTAAAWRWRDEAPVWALPRGRNLVIERRSPFSLHHGWDGWQNVAEHQAVPGAFGMWQVHFSSEELSAHRTLEFTRSQDGRWEGRDHSIRLDEEPPDRLVPAQMQDGNLARLGSAYRCESAAATGSAPVR